MYEAPVSTSGGDRELRILLEVLRMPFAEAARNSLPEEVGGPIDWNRLLSMANWHGLTPLVASLLDRQPAGPVPEHVLLALQESSRHAAQHNLVLAAELMRISRQLQSQGIEHLAYKGPLLAFDLYGSLALRVSGDLDIVVPKPKIQQACRALSEMGFVEKSGLTSSQRAAGFRFGFEHTLSRPGGIEIDLHWRIVPSFVSPSLDERGLWQRAIEIPLFGQMVPTFCPEDLLLALCLHAGQHEWTHLSMFCDLGRLLVRYPWLQWDIVRHHLGDSNTTRTVLVSLCLLHRHCAAPIPEDLAAQIAADREVCHIANKVEREFWPAAEFPLPRDASIAWLLQRTRRERYVDRLRYIAGIALNPTAIDYETFKLPRHLVALYPLFRGVRLALKRSR